MFFIGIFGIENKDKEIKILSNLWCKKCSNTVTGKLIKSYSYFHFFFIPLLKWNEKYFIVCDGCLSTYLISKEKGKAIEQGENIEITYWDLQEVYGDYYENGNNSLKVCKSCGARIEVNYKYCPHCGAKN